MTGETVPDAVECFRSALRLSFPPNRGGLV